MQKYRYLNQLKICVLDSIIFHDSSMKFVDFSLFNEIHFELARLAAGTTVEHDSKEQAKIKIVDL